jgi:uncharacterized protein YndB with AHSA1/START domain
MNTIELTETLHVAAPPETVARAIASPYGLTAWCCDEARSEMKEGGRLLLQWQDGRQATGRWSSFDPVRHLAFSALDDQGAILEASFTLAPGAGTTALSAEISAPATTDDPADVAAEWRQRLADLGAFAAEGVYARQARRPMLGIWGDFERDEDGSGAFVGGVVDGGGAEKAGLGKGDTIVAIDEGAITGWGDLGAVLDAHDAGDTVAVRVLREGEVHDLSLTLDARQPFDAPTDPGEIEARGEALIERLEAVLDGLDPAEADFRPDMGEWSIREVLAHLIASERFAQMSLQARARDADPVGWIGGPETLLQRVLRTRPFSELRTQLVEDLRLSLGLARAVLDDDADPALARAFGENLAFTEMHVNDHIGQISANRTAARETRAIGG